MSKILTIVGARPQFIKLAPVNRALTEAKHVQFLLHTGQHYDYQMSRIFFEELDIPYPNINLEIGSASHGRQTGQMLMEIEKVLLAEKPDWVIVYGDTNSTIAGALAAVKLHISIAHIEAGLRSFNRCMPEEHNRVLTDHCADLLFCPTQTAVGNLENEGVSDGIHFVGDTMYDAVLQFSDIAHQRSLILQELDIAPQSYFLTTVHRPYNTDVPENLTNLISAFLELNQPVIFPVHPRTRQRINDLGLKIPIGSNLRLIDPVGYLDMLMLEQNARLIMTDSGGIQKEAYFFKVPCVTLRPETEWVETVQSGWNVLVGANKTQLIEAVQNFIVPTAYPMLYGDGQASQLIVQKL